MSVLDQDKKRFHSFLGNMPPGTMLEVEIKTLKAIRSIPQNNFYWWIIVQMLSDHLGYEPEEMHEVLKYLHNSHDLKLPDGSIAKDGKSTTGLNTQEAEEYFDRIRVWALQDLEGFVIPLPNEENGLQKNEK